MEVLVRNLLQYFREGRIEGKTRSIVHYRGFGIEPL